MALALVLNAGQQVTGQGSLNSYSTKIYQKVFTSDSKIALINALNATFGIIFTLNAIWIIDRFGRKFLLIIGGIGMGLCMIIVAAVETETPQLPNGAKSEPVGISIVFLMFLFIFFCKLSNHYSPVNKTRANIISQTNHLGAQLCGFGRPRFSQ